MSYIRQYGPGFSSPVDVQAPPGFNHAHQPNGIMTVWAPDGMQQYFGKDQAGEHAQQLKQPIPLPIRPLNRPLEKTRLLPHQSQTPTALPKAVPNAPLPSILSYDDAANPHSASATQGLQDVPAPEYYPTPAPNFGIEWNSQHTRNLTFHMDLGIEDDTQAHLNILARHRRLGQFKKGLETLNRYREEADREPLLDMEQAEMLLSQGNYKQLATKIEKKPAWLTSLKSQDTTNSQLAQILSLKWSLLFTRCRTHTKVSYANVSQLWEKSERMLSSMRDTGSTELFIYVMCLELIAEVTTYSNSVNPFGTPEFAINWESMYQQLLGEGRIWDLADLIRASTLAFGAANTWENIFHKNFYSDDFFDNIKSDWKTLAYDESTSLALLDILVHLAFWLDIQLCGEAKTSDLFAMERCLTESDEIVSQILKSDPKGMKTRQYALWMLAHAKLKGHTNEQAGDEEQRVNDRYQMKYLDEYPGLQLWHCGLPIYLPKERENPGWTAPEVSDAVKAMIAAPLALARELGDMKTESRCLQELARISSPELPHFLELGRFQGDVQEDMRGLLETLLASYLVVPDKPRLKKELLDFGRKTEEEGPPLLVYSFNVIMGSIVALPEERKQFKALARMVWRSMARSETAGDRHSSLRRRRRRYSRTQSQRSVDEDESSSGGHTHPGMKRWVGVGNVIALTTELGAESSSSDTSSTVSSESAHSRDDRRRGRSFGSSRDRMTTVSVTEPPSGSSIDDGSGWETELDFSDESD